MCIRDRVDSEHLEKIIKTLVAVCKRLQPEDAALKPAKAKPIDKEKKAPKSEKPKEDTPDQDKDVKKDANKDAKKDTE